MSTPVRLNTDITLRPGYQAFSVEGDRDLLMTFRAHADCDVFVNMVKGGRTSFRTFVDAGVKVNFLYWNAAKEKAEIDEEDQVLGDGRLTVAYGECNDADTERKTAIYLQEPGAYALLASTTLAANRKNYAMQVVNAAPHTYGDIHNYAVLLDGGSLTIDAIGKIVKGAYRSESHQTSRAMSFAENQKATILPELLIDEDDVQASHAMSMGSVDEDILYYMESRGLRREDCVALIARGYLLPIADTLDNEQLQNDLRNELERKLASI